MLLCCAKFLILCEYVAGNKTRSSTFLINDTADTAIPELLVLYMLISALSRLPQFYFATVYLGLSDLDTPARKFPVAKNLSLLYSSTNHPPIMSKYFRVTGDWSHLLGSK